MNSDEFPFCCGIQVLGNHTRSVGERITTTIKEVEDAINEWRFSYVLYSLNEHQVHMHKVLKRMKFKKIAVFKNNNTKSTLTLYGRKTRP